jgi:hypothetical protein
MRRCCFRVNRIIMVVAVDRAKIPLTANRQSHVGAGRTAPAGQRPRHDGDQHKVRKYFPTIGAQFRPGFRASIASRDFQYRRVTGILIERPDEMLQAPRRA